MSSFRSSCCWFCLTIMTPFALSMCGSSVATAAERPNILFIMADDHCQAAISAYGSKVMQTPNLDRIANEGMRFDRAVVTNALCGPSRAVLITGKYNHMNGFCRNNALFDGKQQTFPKLLQKAGYETAIVGKWHLQTQPTGFDYYSVIPDQGRFYDCRMKETGAPWENGRRGGVVQKGYLTDVITDKAIGWLKQRETDKPFMLMVHHKAPHNPHQPAPRHKNLFADKKFPEPPTLLDDYKGRVPELMADDLIFSRLLICHYREYKKELEEAQKMNRADGTRLMYQTFMRGYTRLIATLDEDIGRLLDHLDKSGLSDNTIVIYVSDNGFFTGEHGFFNKMFMYEPSLQIPLMVRWPGKVKPGSVNENDLVSMLDVAPLLLDAAGAPIPADMQGRSFKPLLSG
ncbi:MAG: sulfatase, partial [Planctomycetia bacterium]